MELIYACVQLRLFGHAYKKTPQICQQDDGLKVDPGHSWRSAANNTTQRLSAHPANEAQAESSACV